MPTDTDTGTDTSDPRTAWADQADSVHEDDEAQEDTVMDLPGPELTEKEKMLAQD